VAHGEDTITAAPRDVHGSAGGEGCWPSTSYASGSSPEDDGPATVRGQEPVRGVPRQHDCIIRGWDKAPPFRNGSFPFANAVAHKASATCLVPLAGQAIQGRLGTPPGSASFSCCFALASRIALQGLVCSHDCGGFGFTSYYLLRKQRHSPVTLCDLSCGFLPFFSGQLLTTLDVCWGRTGSQGAPLSHGDESKGAGDGDPAVPPRSLTAPRP